MPLLMSSSINLIHPSDFSETKYIASLLRMLFKSDKAFFNQMIYSPSLYLGVINISLILFKLISCDVMMHSDFFNLSLSAAVRKKEHNVRYCQKKDYNVKDSSHWRFRTTRIGSSGKRNKVRSGINRI